MLKALTLAILVVAPQVAWTGAKLAAKDVDLALGKYRRAEAFRAKVKKTVAQEVLGTETTGDGLFYFSKGKLRLEMAEPESTILVYDGRVIWMETRLDSETIEVMKVKSRELKRNDSILAALFERKDLLKTFKLSAAKSEGRLNTYSFKPRHKKGTEIRLLEITLHDQEIQRIAYLDDRENRVTFEFRDIVREAIAKETFAYQPPKGATVTEM